MHTLRMTVAGLIVLAAFVGVAYLLRRSSGLTPARAAQLFIPVWLVAAIANMLVGMFSAGIPFLVEVPVLAVVFGVPAAVAWFASSRLPA